MESGIFFIEPREDSKRKHVIQKIKRISNALNSADNWSAAILVLTFGIVLGSFFYLILEV